VKSLSRVQLFGTPWTAAYQAPPSMGFSRQEYWSRVPSFSLAIGFRTGNLKHSCGYAQLRDLVKIQSPIQ